VPGLLLEFRSGHMTCSEFAVSPTVASLFTTESATCSSINNGALVVALFHSHKAHWLPSTLLGVHRKRLARISQADSGCSSIIDGALLSCQRCCSEFRRGSFTPFKLAQSSQFRRQLLLY